MTKLNCMRLSKLPCVRFTEFHKTSKELLARRFAHRPPPMLIRATMETR